MSSSFRMIPKSARALTAIGDETARAVERLFSGQTNLFPGVDDDDPSFVELAEALRKRRWTDSDAAELINAYAGAARAGNRIGLHQVTRWVLAHDDRTSAATMIACINTEPPPEVEIIRVLSRQGSQKLVFLASWRLRQQEVALKRIIGSSNHVEQVLSRELQPHPLSMVHPNIIETHVLRNSRGESFLVERYLRDVLHDKWRPQGQHEVANLLRDIAKAIRFLHDHEKVHGDIKPDNIGIRQGRFILLDFGICRPALEFTGTTTPTGSLRTRAPELLVDARYDDPYKIDIWAFGATMFNFSANRFPLVACDEAVPRVSNPAERTAFEHRLADRVRTEWEKWVRLELVDPPLRDLVEWMLKRNANERPTAALLLDRVETALAAFLRTDVDAFGALSSRFSPHEEFVQIRDYLDKRATMAALPAPRRRQLRDKLRDLHGVPGFSDNEKQKIINLMESL